MEKEREERNNSQEAPLAAADRRCKSTFSMQKARLLGRGGVSSRKGEWAWPRVQVWTPPSIATLWPPKPITSGGACPSIQDSSPGLLRVCNSCFPLSSPKYWNLGVGVGAVIEGRGAKFVKDSGGGRGGGGQEGSLLRRAGKDLGSCMGGARLRGLLPPPRPRGLSLNRGAKASPARLARCVCCVRAVVYYTRCLKQEAGRRRSCSSGGGGGIAGSRHLFGFPFALPKLSLLLLLLVALLAPGRLVYSGSGRARRAASAYASSSPFPAS